LTLITYLFCAQVVYFQYFKEHYPDPIREWRSRKI